jgi:MFS family permease
MESEHPWKRGLSVLWFANFIAIAGSHVLTLMFPFFIASLNVNTPHAVKAWTGYLWAATLCPVVIALPFWGMVGDRFGHKKMILRAMFGAGTMVLLTSFVQNVWQLLAVRIVHGFLGGFLLACQAYISPRTPKAKVGFVLGVLMSSHLTGRIVGPVLGGFLADRAGIRPLFFMTGLVHYLAALSVFFLIPADTGTGGSRPWPNVFAPVKRIFSNGLYRNITMIRFLADGTTTLVFPLLPLFIYEVLGQQEIQGAKIGFVFTFSGIATVLGTALFGRLGDKTNHKWVLTSCLLAGTLLYIPHAMLSTYGQLLFVRFMIGIFGAGMVPSLVAILVINTEKKEQGSILGVTTSMSTLGSAAGAVFGAKIVNAIGFSVLFYFVSAVLLCCWLLATFKVRKEDTFIHETPAEGQTLT